MSNNLHICNESSVQDGRHSVRKCLVLEKMSGLLLDWQYNHRQVQVATFNNNIKKCSVHCFPLTITIWTTKKNEYSRVGITRNPPHYDCRSASGNWCRRGSASRWTQTITRDPPHYDCRSASGNWCRRGSASRWTQTRRPQRVRTSHGTQSCSGPWSTAHMRPRVHALCADSKRIAVRESN